MNSPLPFCPRSFWMPLDSNLKKLLEQYLTAPSCTQAHVQWLRISCGFACDYVEFGFICNKNWKMFKRPTIGHETILSWNNPPVQSHTYEYCNVVTDVEFQKIHTASQKKIHPLLNKYSRLSNKRAGCNNHAGWKISQN